MKALDHSSSRRCGPPLRWLGLLLIALLVGEAGSAVVKAKGNNARKPNQQQPQQQPAAPPSRGSVYTLDADRFDGPILSLEAGQLSIDSDPPRTVPLDEVDRIEMGDTAAVLLTWQGQDNHDAVQAGKAGGGGNGIQDVHIQVRGMPAVRKVVQIVITGVFSGEATVWMLTPGDTPFWEVQCVRNGTSPTADIYLEPPTINCFGQPLDVMMTFDDKSTFKTRLVAGTHTDAQLKVVKEEGGKAKPAEIEPLVVLATDERIHARSVEIGADALTLRLPTGPELTIPLGEVRGIWLGDDKSEQRKTFDEKLKNAGTTDWALIAGKEKEKEVASVEGSVQAIVDGRLKFLVGDEARKVALSRVLGLVMAAHPAAPRADAFYQTLDLASGDKISGELVGVKPDVLSLHTLWGADVQLPRGEVRSITCRGGRATYLSDLEPSSVEEVSYFDQRRPYHRDQGLAGGPLLVRGLTYRKGLAVHSRCVLTYPLDGRYDSFQARLGFEDGAPLGGSIACRVLADDRELYANPNFRLDSEPVSLKLELAGAKQLVLEVDFGETQDVGDRIVWAAARVVRPERPAGSPAAPEVQTAAAPAQLPAGQPAPAQAAPAGSPAASSPAPESPTPAAAAPAAGPSQPSVPPAPAPATP